MKILSLIKITFTSFLEDDAFTLSASLAFYTILSLSPLIILLLSFAGFIGPETQKIVIRQIESVVGGQSGEIINIVIQNARQNQFAGTISAFSGIVVILFAATTVFANLQKSMNKIWNVKVVQGAKIKNFIRKRVISFIIVLVIGILMLFSITLSAALRFIFSEKMMGWKYVNYAVSLFMYTFVFSLLMKYVPDIRIRWRDVLVGAAMTAFLFNVGEAVIGQAISYKEIGIYYGAAGSLVIFLIWVYYSAMIVFWGTEFTKSYAGMYGSKHEPAGRAGWSEYMQEKAR